ncbi:MAG: DUF362 domain-containing protein [Chitinispirillaceae bacterium]|nr:DUF362 domain-containing protein [Chitinispirillaceae bacterium]
MKRYKNISGAGFEFSESMSGYIGIGKEKSFEKGFQKGKEEGNRIGFRVKIEIPHLDRFLDDNDHAAKLAGEVTVDSLHHDHIPGKPREIENGTFYLYKINPGTRNPEMRYCFHFNDGKKKFYFYGSKEIHDNAGFDMIKDLTTLSVVIYEGEDEKAPVFATGKMTIDLKDVPALFASMKATGKVSLSTKLAAKAEFLRFACIHPLKEYCIGKIVYETGYENLVLSGRVDAGDTSERDFFLVSGVHDEDMPWGDGETFSDVLLVTADGNNRYKKYCITDRTLGDAVRLDIKENNDAGNTLCEGVYEYKGPIYEVTAGYEASFDEMHGSKPRHLKKYNAEIEIGFTAKKYRETSFPFSIIRRKIRMLMMQRPDMEEELHQELNDGKPFGMNITPFTVNVKNGSISLRPAAGNHSNDAPSMQIIGGTTFGEAEKSVFRNIREPTVCYGYTCAINPSRESARVQIHTRTLRDEREHWAKDRFDALVGSLLSRFASAEMLMEKEASKEGKASGTHEPDASNNGLLKAQKEPIPKVRTFDKHEPDKSHEGLLKVLGDPLLRVRNTHYPTAEFHRLIVRVRDPDGGECLALEEAMAPRVYEAINSDKEEVIVSSRKIDYEKEKKEPGRKESSEARKIRAEKEAKTARKKALKTVLEETGFFTVLDDHFAASKKSKEDFLIVIKPNFMFAYNKRDTTTFTDPELVGLLVALIHDHDEQYKKIAVVEAQSTYGEYFHHRSVKEMADYLGYSESDGYTIVDLTEDVLHEKYFGPHLGMHPYSHLWGAADFRISFAKNKTHSYAYYTLTLKNIYGALPYANKFKEYHCKRDIYHTTIEYLKAFPVHYGLIDADISADGPFGIFADPYANETNTIIGGSDLVAVDWVGAVKMGIDPMISTYMRLAVMEFGKPKIRLIGDASVYSPWLNVPVPLTVFTNKVVDANYYTGNLFYSSFAQMDETQFIHKNRALPMRALRCLTAPLRSLFFVRNRRMNPPERHAVQWLLDRLSR